MVRSSVRRTAAFAATAALAVLAGAGPALAAGGGNAPRAVAPAVAAGTQAGTDSPKHDEGSCPHHRGLVSGLLEGAERLVDGLL